MHSGGATALALASMTTSRLVATGLHKHITYISARPHHAPVLAAGPFGFRLTLLRVLLLILMTTIPTHHHLTIWTFTVTARFNMFYGGLGTRPRYFVRFRLRLIFG